MTHYMVKYDGFTFITDDHVFADTIPSGRSEPYPCHLAIVQRYLRAFPEKNRTYVDVGAHIGTTIMPYSRMYSNIVGFEANPKNYDLLRANVATNSVDCKIYNNGLYDHPCKGDILKHPGGNSGCYYFKKSDNGSIECRCLDEYALDTVDFLKIDTEGSEMFVLKGAEKTLLRCRPLIQFECNSLSESLYAVSRNETLEYLYRLGYVIYDSSDSVNMFLYYPEINPNRIFCCWTGNTPMTGNRRACLEDMKTTECEVTLITPANLGDYILQAQPLHPAYEFLSETHKADYLRTYLMHFYGGGYADIKQQGGSWKPAFEELLRSDALLVGYKEGGASCIAGDSLREFWKELVGNCAYICQPNTVFTTQWYTSMNRVLDEKLSELRIHPARWSRDKKEDGGGYPIEWDEMLGRIFHRVNYIHRARILQTLPSPKFTGYL